MALSMNAPAKIERRPLVQGEVLYRPGVKKLHTFRSRIVAMAIHGDRIIVILANGKAYISNKKHTRWRKVKASEI